MWRKLDYNEHGDNVFKHKIQQIEHIPGVIHSTDPSV